MKTDESEEDTWLCKVLFAQFLPLILPICPQSSKCNKVQIISPVLNSTFQLNDATYLPNYIKDHNQNNIIHVCYLQHCLISDYCTRSSCSFSLQGVAHI